MKKRGLIVLVLRIYYLVSMGGGGNEGDGGSDGG